MIEEMEDIVLQIINEVIPKKNNRGRKPKNDNLFYLRKIVYVQQSDIKWNYLECDVHFTTVYKVFRKWSQYKVFEIAHRRIINTIYDNGNTLRNMCMDSADILNKLAYESVDYTYKYKNKKALLARSPVGLKQQELV